MRCCNVDCPSIAEYRIEWGEVANPDNYTEACEAHVGMLLGHHLHQPPPDHYRVYPIGSSSVEPTGAQCERHNADGTINRHSKCSCPPPENGKD